MFGWHKEDMDLYSINYVHHGAPKFWYGVNIDSNLKFEAFLKSKFPEFSKLCSEFIRHKNTMVNPDVLIANGIGMTKSIHKEGEFMISRCAGYHAGFNFGFNIAEAVNFALPDWLKLADTVSACRCVGDSVRIDMGKFYKNISSMEEFRNLIKYKPEDLNTKPLEKDAKTKRPTFR
jgi:hypothetical protein